MTDNNATPDQDPRQSGSAAERSARLEAEAAAIYDAAHDPLAPEPLVGEDPADIDEPTGDDARIEALQDDLDKARDRAVRALAEAENTRKRAVKEREDAAKFAVSGFAKDILEVADNLRRALDAVPAELVQENEQVKNLLDGIEATERTLLRSFEKNGVQKLEPLDEAFDPNFHEVMFEGPAADKAPGTIIQVIETGYILNGRLLRPARVGIAKDEGQGNPAASGGKAGPGGNIDTQA